MTATSDNPLRTEKLSGRHRFIGSHALVTASLRRRRQPVAAPEVLIRKHAGPAGTSLLRHALHPRPQRADDVEGR